MNIRLTRNVLLLLGALAGALACPTGTRAQAPRDPAKNEAWLVKEARLELVMLPLYSVSTTWSTRSKAIRLRCWGRSCRRPQRRGPKSA